MSTSSSPIQEIQFDKAIEDRYLAYALSTIMSRSLPDVRDGLKPVHRRLIYAMQQLKLNPHSSFKKCARIVGDAMGKFHPHGDTAIYDALVRLAQDFSVRYPLIEGQGNFGNIDGDDAAAMRYTEARLSDVAIAMMEGIEQDCVDFRPTYDGETEEPVIFPTLFPNLLANGATGIAVGMATSIPPHNVDEICQALDYLIENPESSTRDLMKFMQGPDFPTGGLLMEDAESLCKAYETGKGSFRIRARWSVEEGKNGFYKIIIDQMPYLVEKAKVVEKIASLILEKKNSFIDDVQDESTDEIRLVIYPKNRHVNSEILMESLFQQTDLEVRFSLNMNVLDVHSIPRVMNLKEVLSNFLQHAHHIQLRQTHYNLHLIENRLNILNGFLIAYLNLDQVIHIIRESEDPKKEMIETFSINDEQAENILNMRLKSLRKLQELEIRTELNDLSQKNQFLQDLLKNEKKQWQYLRKSFQNIRKKFGYESSFGARRTKIIGKANILSLPAEVIEEEEITVLCSEKNWIRALKGKQDIGSIKYKEGDHEKFVLSCSTLDKILIFVSNGRVYTLEAHKIPQTKGNGESLRLMIEIPDNEEIIVMHVLTPSNLENEEKLFLVLSNTGYGFLTKGQDLLAQTKNGRQILMLKKEEKALFFEAINDNDMIAMIGTNRKMVVFSLSEIPFLVKGRGVKLQKYKGGQLSDIQLFKKEKGFIWKKNDQTRTLVDVKAWLVHRGALGRLPPPLFPRDNKFHAHEA